MIVHPQTVVADAVVDGESESVLETPKTLMWSPADAAGGGDADVRDAAGRTACGRRRGTKAATAAPACRPVQRRQRKRRRQRRGQQRG